MQLLSSLAILATVLFAVASAQYGAPSTIVIKGHYELTGQPQFYASPASGFARNMPALVFEHLEDTDVKREARFAPNSSYPHYQPYNGTQPSYQPYNGTQPSYQPYNGTQPSYHPYYQPYNGTQPSYEPHYNGSQPSYQPSCGPSHNVSLIPETGVCYWNGSCYFPNNVTCPNFQGNVFGTVCLKSNNEFCVFGYTCYFPITTLPPTGVPQYSPYYSPYAAPFNMSEPFNMSAPVYVPSNWTQPIYVPSNWTQPIYVPSNWTQPIYVPYNWTQPIYVPSNWTQPIYVPSNWTQPIYTPSNWTQPIYVPSNWTQPIYVPSNSSAPFYYSPYSNTSQPSVYTPVTSYNATGQFTLSMTQPLGPDPFPLASIEIFGLEKPAELLFYASDSQIAVSAAAPLFCSSFIGYKRCQTTTLQCFGRGAYISLDFFIC